VDSQLIAIIPLVSFGLYSTLFPTIKLSPFLFDYLPSAYLFSAQL